MAEKLTDPMLAMLLNARAGRNLKHGLYGRSQHGGAEWTIAALVKRGMIKHGRITDYGLEALGVDVKARTIIADLLTYIYCNTCTHETTHRGGAIWTICDGCGKQWADDRGGFVPHEWPESVKRAKAYIGENSNVES